VEVLVTIRLKTVSALLGAALLLTPAIAAAQSAGSSGMGSYQAGYGGSRYTTARPQTGSTRDQNGNRLVVDGIIQAGANSYSSASGGVSSSYSGVGGGSGGTAIGGSTAIGNSLNVVVQGNHNTVIVNSRQVNNGNVTAGTNLNGTLRLP
jgi:holdfast attachment protein HfaA